MEISTEKLLSEPLVSKRRRTVVAVEAPDVVAQANALRYERKFSVSELDARELEWVLKTNPALFSSIYEPRFINNIYLDTPDRQFYQENVAGVASRLKVRIRWYGAADSYVEDPQLELKMKRGLAGWKVSYSLDTIRLEDAFNRGRLLAHCEAGGLPHQVITMVKSLEPVLLNRYRRSYYLSACGAFRCTLDTALSYARTSSFGASRLHHIEDYGLNILELKYDVQNDGRVSEITESFPFRLSRNSKYVRGLSITS